MVIFIKKFKFEIILVTPLIFYIVFFTYIPVLQVIWISFNNSQSPFEFVFGFKNYEEIFYHSQFFQAVTNTVVVTFAALFLELTLGMFVAVQLNKKIKFIGFMRSIYLLPLGIPTIVAASNMRYIFDTNGFINEFLKWIGIISVPINWSAGGFITLSTVIVSDMWKVTPMVMLILLSGLQSIPSNINDAAKIDGASQWQIFSKITLPLLRPAITMALIIRGIDCFRIFELPLVLVGKSEPFLATFAYTEYSESLNPYTSAADSVILLLLIIVSIIGYLYITNNKKPENYSG